MTDRELMQMALDAMRAVSVDEHLCNAAHHVKKDRHGIDEPCPIAKRFNDIAEALRARLAQPEPEPVAWMYEYGTDHGDAVNQIFWHKNLRLEKSTGLVRNVVPLYTAPPQREWQGLTGEEIMDACSAVWASHPIEVGRVVEEKLKEKNS